jgi:hypothetical protein
LAILRRVFLIALFISQWAAAGGDFPFPLRSDSNYSLINAWQIQDMDQVVSLYQSHDEKTLWILGIQNSKTREFLAEKAINPSYQIKEYLDWNKQKVFIDLNLHAQESDDPGYIQIDESKYQLFFNTIFCQSL